MRNHCDALETAFEKGKAGEVYCIGGDNEWMNIELVHHICDILNELVGEGPDGDYKNLISFVTDRPGHDFRYAIDASKIENELGWEADENFETGIEKTIAWYLEKFIKKDTKSMA